MDETQSIPPTDPAPTPVPSSNGAAGDVTSSPAAELCADKTPKVYTIDITPTQEYYADFLAEQRGLRIHPACDLFPVMDHDSLTTLAANIGTNGLVHPIVLDEGKILDGRNRLLACTAAKVEPRFVEWRDVYKGPMTVAQWIWSINVERRHLTIDQITAAKTALNAWAEQEAARQRRVEARQQQGEHGKEGGRGRKKPSVTNSSSRVSDGTVEVPGEESPQSQPERQKAASSPDAGSVRQKLAKEIGTSEYKVQQSLDVQKANPDLLMKVAQGKVKMRDAARQVKGEKPKPPTAKRQVYNLKETVARAVRSLEKVLASCPKDKREALLAEVIKAIKRLPLQK